MRSSTRWRRVLSYVMLGGGLLIGLLLFAYAFITVYGLREDRARVPQEEQYVLDFRGIPTGVEMNFAQLLALHIALQWLSFFLILLLGGWITRLAWGDWQLSRKKFL